MTEQMPEIPSWQLGEHRLVCGDCTDRRVVTALMQSEQADMVFMDPPYGVRYAGKTKPQKLILGDCLAPEETRQMIAKALSAAPLKSGGTFYLCSAPGSPETMFRLAIADAGLQLRQSLAWVKQHFILGRQDYHWKHETLLYGWKDGARHYFVPDRTQHTVWEFRRPTKSLLHPTMKPVDLIEKAIRNSSLPGNIVYDGFGGSGSTLIACESTQRRCRMIEIDPQHCAVILSRWEEETGKTAQRIMERSATPHPVTPEPR